VSELPYDISVRHEIDRLNAEIASLNRRLAEAEGRRIDGFTALREANAARQIQWANGESVGLLFRATELGGETGEVLNVCKKLERERMGWRGSRATVEDLSDELADVVICADLLAMTVGIDLYAAVVRKFNATSEKVGLPQRLTPEKVK
jgi:NTP pyrophosphatase (non-canonical NTP hydrolase)